MAWRVYISASTQKENIGVLNYGTEQDRMMELSDRVKYWLKTQGGKFEVFRNQPGYTLSQTVNDCNSLACDLFIDNHTNAGAPAAAGTEVFYNHKYPTGNGYKIAELLYKHIAPLSPGKDRGILPDNRYVGSLFVIQKTQPPACLIEHIFHTNCVEVSDFLRRMDEYAKAEAKAICEYFGEKWIEPTKIIPLPPLANLVQELSKEIPTLEKAKWIAKGTKDMDVYYLIKKIVETRKGA